ncbi:MAG: hypothetical protein LKJ80_01735 [Oscillibacter sp.]|nr:hypothetical protein [Oscillibacter sp.]
MQSPPEFFDDLGLSRIIARAGRGCEELWPFYTPLSDPAVIRYRQEVGRDLEDAALRYRFAGLAQQLRALSRQLSAHRTEDFPWVRCSDLLSAAGQYLEQLRAFLEDFPYGSVHSEGLESFLLHIRQHLNSARTVQMSMELSKLERELCGVDYCILLDGNTLRVGGPGKSQEIDGLVESLFDRFGQENFGGGTCQAPGGEQDVRNEDAVLSLLAREHPETFRRLADFGRRYGDFADPGILAFARELPFYLGYLDATDGIARAGGSFCYPALLDGWDGCRGEDGFDLALAMRLQEAGGKPVENSFALHGRERILVVTGPNQGGKTTYARMLGQIFYLASLGVRVPGRAAALRIPDRICTHFGKAGPDGADGLRQELTRLRGLLEQTTQGSLVILNEIFASASHGDGVYLGEKLMERLTDTGCMAVFVTFLYELADCGPAVVSVMSEIRPGTAAERSYHIARHAPNGCAYALSLAEKLGLTREKITGRLEQ